MLTEKKLNYFKKVLAKRLEELSSADKKIIIEEVREQDDLYEFVDQALVESERDLNYRIREREGRLADKIQDAIDRIKSGEFGICEECEEEISEKRLRARPVATLCISCKKKQEVLEKVRDL